ncbi:hypothetical protein ECZU25_57160 [Escherichia coli]|nr:hypothetical protein ECZU25_57160 [Escherichia coli]
MTEEQHVQAAEARRNLATVLKRNADRGMFTINLSTGHERTLYAFLDPACINCRLLEPALKQLAREFSVVIYPVSVIGGEASTNRTAPLLCEPDSQNGRPDGISCIPQTVVWHPPAMHRLHRMKSV